MREQSLRKYAPSADLLLGSAAALLARRRAAVMKLQRLQLSLDDGIALDELRAVEVEGRQRPLQCKQVLVQCITLLRTA